jgi:hypothetical protein
MAAAAVLDFGKFALLTESIDIVCCQVYAVET